MKLITLVILGVCLNAVGGEKARFDNYRVYSIDIDNEKQLNVLEDLENQQDGLTFIRPATAAGTLTEVIVPPHKFADISELCGKFNMTNEILIENLQQLIDEEQPDASTRAAYGWKQYYNINDIYGWLDSMLIKYPRELTNYNIGLTHEKRTIRAVKFSAKPERKNPIIFIESTIHAREWITAATATFILNELLTSNDPETMELAENYDFVIIPVVNVDGYQYSHSSNRMWRKNRRPQVNSCIGIDANRNFDFHHAESGASTNPCSESFAGTKPFSEPESRALAEFIQSFDNIRLYLSFHSYGQMLLFPYGHSKQRAVNYNSLNQIAFKAKEAIQKRYGTQYAVGSIADVLYLASGTTIDWVYATQNVPLAYTFEFRDRRNGRYGFVLPPNQIIPNALETLDGLKAMVKEARMRRYM